MISESKAKALRQLISDYAAALHANDKSRSLTGETRLRVYKTREELDKFIDSITSR